MQKTLESLPDFKKFQVQFTSHIRHPQKNRQPVGVPTGRMKIYNELVFNGFEDVLSGCFPVLKKILKNRKWTRLIRDFLAEHSCQKPFYRQIPDEFIDYLQNDRKSDQEDPPFLLSLAHYEWMELVLFLAPDDSPLPLRERVRVRGDSKVAIDEIDWNGNLLENHPVFAPTATLLNYSYPVHQISPKFQPQEPSNEFFYYLLFRNLEDEVKFIVLNAVSARLVDLLLNSNTMGKEAIQQVAEELNHPDPKIILEGGSKTLQELKKEGAILGILKE